MKSWLTLCSSLLVLPGCLLGATRGEYAALEFQIVADDAPGGVLPVNAIAPGTEVVLRVRKVGGDAVLVTDWLVEEPWVAEVTRGSANELRVRALTEADTTITVRGAGTSDRIRLQVRRVVSAEVMRPFSPRDERSGYVIALRGEHARFLLSLLGPLGEPVVALGAAPPIRVVPPAAVTLAEVAPRSGAALDATFEQAGLVRFEGNLRPSLSVYVAEPGDLRDLELESFTLETKPKAAPRHDLIYTLRARFGDERGRLGVQAGAIVSTGAELSIDTPDVCAEFAAEARAEARSWLGNATVLIEATKPGQCAGTVRFAGLSATFSESVTPRPADKPRKGLLFDGKSPAKLPALAEPPAASPTPDGSEQPSQ